MLSVPPEIFQAIGVVLSLLLWGIGRPFLSTVSRSVLGAITVSTVMALAVFVPGIRWSAEPLPGGYGTVEPSGGTLPVRGFSDSSVAGISDSREDPVGVGVLTFADIRNAVRKTLREAGGSIDSRSIARHAIEADDIDTGSVTGRTIRDHSVSSRDLADRIEIGMLSADRISVDDDMSVGGYIRLSDAEVPSSTEGRLYNVGGMLYWSGILLSDSFSDVWSSDGVHAWRSTGNVGIGTTAPSQKLSVAGTVGILEGGSGAQYYTIFRGGDQNADVTYILPVASSNGLLRNTGGTLSWDTTTYLSSYTETDPVFVASAAHGITASNVSNWNTTYGWGNHASAGYLSASSYTAADVLAKMLTVDGSGSTLDADLLDGHDTSYFYPASNPNAYIADGNTGWDNSYGFIASYTETDPVFTASASHSITSTNVTNWNAAYGWGNHASAGYLSAASYTAADVLAKTLTVDGSGSTLDADLLDGHDTSYFQTALTNPVTGTGSSGHVPYWSSSSALTYDSDGNFYWDATNNRLAIGTTTTTQQLTLTGSIALPATTTSTT
ncbi:MAG: hypothetical protein HGB18_05345, partial [Candidatus Moranbacteria bacterium]|nr:hypothetical protein [Candidatus Moranbacteria bacterium]